MQEKIVLYGCSEQGFVEYEYLRKLFPDREYFFVKQRKQKRIIEVFL